jgi:hypothetical protein
LVRLGAAFSSRPNRLSGRGQDRAAAFPRRGVFHVRGRREYPETRKSVPPALKPLKSESDQTVWLGMSEAWRDLAAIAEQRASTVHQSEAATRYPRGSKPGRARCVASRHFCTRHGRQPRRPGSRDAGSKLNGKRGPPHRRIAEQALCWRAGVRWPGITLCQPFLAIKAQLIHDVLPKGLTPT